MKKWFYILALLLAVCVTTAPAQEYKWGFIDKTGKWVILPQFDYVEDFSEGLAAVEVGKRIGYIDHTGKFVISPQFKKSYNMGFHEGLAAVEVEGNYGKWGWGVGYIDKNGKFVIPLRSDYAFAGEFHEGLASIGDDFSTGEFYGFVDHSGKMVVPVQFWRVRDFSEGLAASYGGELGRIGYISKTGSWVVAPQFAEAWDFKEGRAAVLLDYDSQWGFIDGTGKMVIEPQYDGARNFSEGLAAVTLGESYDSRKFGYIDKTGKVVIPLIFDSAEEFNEGLAAVSIDEKWGYIDKSGRRIIQIRFDEVKNFRDGMAAVSVNNKWGYVDKAGNEIVPCKYAEAMSFHEGLAAVKVAFEQYQRDSAAYVSFNVTVQNTWRECNKQLLEYPYNIEEVQLKAISTMSYFSDPRLRAITDSIVRDLKQKTSKLQYECYNDLKANRPEMFAGIYMQQHPELKSVLENLKLECRCNNYSEAELVIKIADNTVPQCTCRNEYWNQYGNLFSSRAEFDKMYNTSEQGFLDDVKLRQSLKADIKEIASMLSGLKAPKFKDGLTGKNESVIQLLQKVQYHKGKYFYDEVVEMMFAADASMTKEWEKKGSFFSSRNEFYEAYVSGDYKNVLKEKKSK